MCSCVGKVGWEEGRAVGAGAPGAGNEKGGKSLLWGGLEEEREGSRTVLLDRLSRGLTVNKNKTNKHDTNRRIKINI